MKKTKLLFFSALIYCGALSAQQNIQKYISVYFTQPVDNSYSNDGISAVYCPNSMFDTLAAYINRAKYTVDIAQYEYHTYTGDPIATAINAAYTRGVKVRYIQDGSEASGNTGVKLLNSSIYVETSPTGGNYNIMHNKFVIIDEYSPDTTKTWVWTGSPDWDQDMTTGDYNNAIVFQSKVLARAFTHEFDIMWGDTTHGVTYNSSAALFGYKKPNSGTHRFTIGGSEVELYFSPSDTTQNHIIDVIKSAKTDLYCGMNTFTETSSADSLVSRYKAGVSTYAIVDAYSSSGQSTITTILPNGLGSNFTPYNNATYLYHSKYVFADPSEPCENPMVLTGSHNWTSSAETENDENTVIVHNDTIANLYLQAFANDFKVISGGTAVTKIKNTCTTGISTINNIASEINIFPNPFNTQATITYNLATDQNVTIELYNIMGQKITTLANGKMLEAGMHTFYINSVSAGVYILKVQEGMNMYTAKLVAVN